jgi:GNAT superfamily N-acetyltransferase
VDISIDCVLEDQMGTAYVDSLDDPQCFMIEQDSFFVYLAGDLASPAGRAFMSHVPRKRFLMSGPKGWHDIVTARFDEDVLTVPRYQFASEALSLAHVQHLAADNPHTPHVERIDETLAGMDFPFLEIGAFESAADFVERGIGYCLRQEDQVIGVAYSSLVCSSVIEVSIVVDEAHRRQGVATALCCQLLQWCLEHHLSPHWDAANEESCLLAEKLGYKRIGDYTAYFLR